MTGHMVWYDPDRKPATATSPEELRALLDRIQANPEYQDIPTMAQIAAAADGQRVLQIGLGRPDYSVMLWFDKASGDALISVGVADDDPAFEFRRHLERIENGSATPVAAALDAAREFAGQRKAADLYCPRSAA